MREKVVKEPVKVPHLTDAVARLLRAGNPHSMTNKKLIAAAQVAADELCVRIQQELKRIQPERIQLVRYSLGRCTQCKDDWWYTKSLLQHRGLEYGSKAPLSDRGAFHLAREIVKSGGYDAWVATRLKHMGAWIFAR